MTPDPTVVSRAAEAWKRASQDASSDEPDGTFLDDSADLIISRAVGPYTRATAHLYRAYESEVYRRAAPPKTRRQPTLAGCVYNRSRLTDRERAEIVRLLEAGVACKAIAKAVGRSLPMVYRVRAETAA